MLNFFLIIAVNMYLGYIFLIFCWLYGLLLYNRDGLGFLEKSAISLIYGIGVTTLVIYYISYFVGLNSKSIVLGSFFSLVASVMMSHIFYSETSFGCKIDARKYICDNIKKIFTASKKIILGFRYMNKLEYLSFL